MDLVAHDVLEREQAGLPVERHQLRRRTTEYAALKTLQPAAVYVLSSEETADALSFKPALRPRQSQPGEELVRSECSDPGQLLCFKRFRDHYNQAGVVRWNPHYL